MLRRQQLKYALPSLAVATLYSYPVWQQARFALLPEATHFRNESPHLVMIVVALLHTLVVAAGLSAAAALAIWLKPGATKVLDSVFVCGIVALFLAHFPFTDVNWLLGPILAVLLVSICLFGLAVPRYQRPFLSAGCSLACSLAMLPAILACDLVLLYGKAISVEDGSFSRKRASGRASKRLIWVVLDEFDPGIALTGRPAGLKLPVLDRLLMTSVSGADVDPAGGWTRDVIPAYLTGRRVDRVRPEGFSDLRIWFTNGNESTLSKQKTIFDRMKAMQVRSAATGWYNPICRWLDRNCLDECVWVPSIDAISSVRREQAGSRLGLSWALRQSFVTAATLGKTGSWEEYHFVRENHMAEFERLHESGLRQVADPSLGFLFLHYNVPHPLGIYDSRRGVLDASDRNTYLDNLVLTDRVLGELLKAASALHGVERTAFLITSDHSFRPEIWGYKPTWELEAPEVRAHPKDPRVLFLFHDPSDGRKVVVKEKLNAISGHDLALAWMRGQLQGHEAVASWLRQDKSPDR